MNTSKFQLHGYYISKYNINLSFIIGTDRYLMFWLQSAINKSVSVFIIQSTLNITHLTIQSTSQFLNQNNVFVLYIRQIDSRVRSQI